MQSLRTIVSFAVLLVAGVPAFGATLVVDCEGGGDFLSVQDAVESAASGDTILVEPCVYTEEVHASGKCLVIQGAGAGVTELLSSGSGPTMTIDSLPAPYEFTMRDISVTNVNQTNGAVQWDEHGLVLSDCRVTGDIDGGDSYLFEDA